MAVVAIPPEAVDNKPHRSPRHHPLSKLKNSTTMTDTELKELIASLILAQKETDKQIKETDKKLRMLQKKTDKQLNDLGKQIGGLGEKFGSFTEGLALPSMQKILQKEFKMEVISPSVRVSKNGHHLEIDVLAYANGEINEAYVVEVKSHLREEAIQQLRSILERFRLFFPEHKDKKVFGVLAAVDMSAAMRERVLKEGFYAARIKDEVFKLDVPKGFAAKAY